MTRKVKTAIVGVRRSLSAAVNQDATTIDDVLAAINDGKVDIQALYAAYAEHKGEDIEQSDEANEMIAGVIVENGELALPGDDDFDGKVWADLIHDALQLSGPTDDEVVSGITDAKRQQMSATTRDHALAVEMGRKLSDAFQAEVAETVKMDIRKARLPITCGADLVNTFGLDTILHVFPRPGSKGKSYQDGNRQVLFDRYRLLDDDGDKHSGDFYREMYLATPQGVLDAQEVQNGKDASNPKVDHRKLPPKWQGVTKDGAGNPEPLSAETCKEMMAPAVKRISTGTQLLRRSVGYLQAFHLIKGEFPAILLSLTMTKKLDDNGNPVKNARGNFVMEESTGPTPIQMYPNVSVEPHPSPAVRRFSADSLAKIFVGNYPETETPKLDRIRELVGEGMTQWSAVMGAIKRKPKGEGETGKGTNVPEVKVPAFTSHEYGRQGLMEVARWFVDDNGDMIKDRHAALLTWLTSKGSDRNDRILTVGRACLAFQPIWDKIEHEYNKIVAEKLVEDMGGPDKAKAIADKHNAGVANNKPKSGLAAKGKAA